MNQNIKQALVRVEYHGQYWFKCINISEISNEHVSFTIRSGGKYIRQCLEGSDSPSDQQASGSSP